MISLSDYSINNIFKHIFESKFTNKNYISGSNNIEDFHYSIAVINDLLNDEDIKLINGKIINVTMLKPDKSKKDLEAIQGKGTYETFCDLFDETKIRELGIQKLSQLWSNIEKSKYSKGSSDGGNAEILVCYLFNNPNATDEDLRKIAKEYKLTNEEWIESTKNTISVLRKERWSNNNYVALQVDGKGTEYINESNFGNLGKDNAIALTSLFYSKDDIAKHIPVLKDDIKSLYSKRKDEWNKADILLLKTDNDYFSQIQRDFSSDTPKYVGLEGFKKMCKEYTINEIIIPISLKKTPDSSAKLFSHNIKEDEEKSMYIDGIADIEVPANPMPDENDDKNGSLYLVLRSAEKTAKPEKIGLQQFKGKKTENMFSVQFYKRASSSNEKPTAKVELQLKNSKGGSGFQQICNSLNTTTSTCYATGDRVKEAVKEYFNWTNDADIPKTINECKNWYVKPCFTCLIGLLDIFAENNDLKHNPDILLPFVNFVIGACEGDGAYYIIK